MLPSAAGKRPVLLRLVLHHTLLSRSLPFALPYPLPDGIQQGPFPSLLRLPTSTVLLPAVDTYDTVGSERIGGRGRPRCAPPAGSP